MDYPDSFLKYSTYKQKPSRFFSEVLHIEPFPWQKEILKTIEVDFCKKKSENTTLAFAIAGANGTGKSHFGMQLMLWHFCSHPGSRNIMLTNSERQTKRTGYSLLQEKLLELFPGKEITSSDKRTCFKTKEIDTEGVWDMMYFTQTRVESGMTGLHDKNMFFFYDECIDFPEQTFRALENMWTQGRVLSYCSANPINTGTAFHELFIRKNKLWQIKNISAFDLPEKMINKDLIEYKKAKYGEKSSAYRSSVLGLFPTDYTQSSFPVMNIYAAMQNSNVPVSIEPSVMAIDVAESNAYGSACAICLRKGNEVFLLEDYSHSYEEFRLLVIHLIQTRSPNSVVIDANGAGFALYTELNRLFGWSVTPLKPHMQAIESSRFHDRRTELLYRASEWVRNPHAKMPFDDDILRFLPKIRFEHEKDKLHATPKKELKKDRSLLTGVLDKIDAFSYTFLWEAATLEMNNVNNMAGNVFSFKR